MSGTTAIPPSAPALAESRPAPARPGREHFRTDVEGLRAIAVTAVVAFHAAVPGFAGGFVGVDVFFVISGFLITGLLLRELGSTGRIDFRGFYARRARRIIPAASVVLIATCLASIAVEPLLGVYNTSRGILAAGLFLSNWHFIELGTDYFTTSAESPVLHYWSLAVEEQFYLVWPLLLLGAFFVARRRGASGLVAATAAIVGVTVLSLGASILLTESDPTLAYMATHTRAWEFGVGGLLAVGARFLAGLDAAWSRVGWTLGWAGLGAVVFSIVAYDESLPFPGSSALVPVLGTAAIIAGGILAPGRATAVGGLLSLAPVRYLGRVSFGWYLWHWPVLILVETEVGELPWTARSGLMLVALILAIATYHLVEQPISRWRQLARRAAAAIAVGLLGMTLTVTAALGTGTSAVASLSSTEAAASVDTASFEQVFGPDAGANSGPVSPNPLAAPDDEPVPTDCLLDREVGEVLSCEIGVAGGFPVVLFGDSHAHQWLPAFVALAEQREWEVSVFAKAGCPVHNIRPRDDDSRFSDPECVTWRDASIDAIERLRPGLIVTSSLHTYLPDRTEALTAWEDSLERLRAADAPIVYLRDTPNPEEDIPTCISSAFDDWSRCAFPHDGVAEPIIEEAITGRQPGVTVVDLLPYFCDGSTCAAVRNGLLLYRDDSHITATAAEALAPALDAALVESELLDPVSTDPTETTVNDPVARRGES